MQTRPWNEDPRDALRSTPRSLLGSTPVINFLTGLLALTSIIVLVAIRSPERLSVEQIQSMTLLSSRGLFTDGKLWTLATANLFPAGSPLGLHLLVQLVVLLWLGRALERRLGELDTAILVVGAALFTSGLFLVLDPWTIHGVLGGGEGLVFGVIACTATIAPRERMIDGISLPAPLWLIACVLVVLEMAMRTRSPGAVSPAMLWAPLGGLAWGILFARFPLGLDRWRDHRRRTAWQRRRNIGDVA